MPEAAMYEYHFTSSGERKVRLARQVSPVQAKAIAQCMYEAGNFHLGLRVLAPDGSHVLAAIHIPSLLKFSKKPFQDRQLFLLSCSSNLR